MVDLFYGPVEHYCWAGENKLIPINEKKWGTITVWFWITSLYLSLIKLVFCFSLIIIITIIIIIFICIIITIYQFFKYNINSGIFQLKLKKILFFRTLRKYKLLKRQEQNCDKSKPDPRYLFYVLILIII